MLGSLHVRRVAWGPLRLARDGIGGCAREPGAGLRVVGCSIELLFFRSFPLSVEFHSLAAALQA